LGKVADNDLMSGFLSGPQFGRKLAIRVGIFLALTLGFPFIVYGLVIATGASRVAGAAGALAVVAGVYLKPVIIGVFLISLVMPCWRRMRSLGLPAYWGLIVPILIAADATYLLVLGTHWGVAFSLGIWRITAPFYALAALVMGLAMSFALPPSRDEPSGLARFGAAGDATKWLGLAVVAIALCLGAMNAWNFSRIWTMSSVPRVAPHFSPAYLMLSKASGWLYLAKPFVCVAFGVMIVWFTVMSRQDNDDGETPRKPGNSSESTVTLLPRNASPPVFGKR
jgi:hypothetical protein